MPMGNSSQSDLAKLIFQNTNFANIGDATGLRGSTAAGSFYIALHTASPGAAGDQTTSEATYTGYARVAVARSGAGFTIAGSSPTNVTNAAAVTFGVCTVGTNTITFFSIGVASAGASEILVYGAITSPAAGLVVNPGITPSFAIGQLTATVD